MIEIPTANEIDMAGIYSPPKNGAIETGPSETGPSETGPSETGPSEAGATETGPTEVDLTYIPVPKPCPIWTVAESPEAAEEEWRIGPGPSPSYRNIVHEYIPELFAAKVSDDPGPPWHGGITIDYPKYHALVLARIKERQDELLAEHVAIHNGFNGFSRHDLKNADGSLTPKGVEFKAKMGESLRKIDENMQRKWDFLYAQMTIGVIVVGGIDNIPTCEGEGKDLLFYNNSALRREIDRKNRIESAVAQTCYDIAKKQFEEEKKRHKAVLASFEEEKAKHKAETARHKVAIQKFKADAATWRTIYRREREDIRKEKIDDELRWAEYRETWAEENRKNPPKMTPGKIQDIKELDDHMRKLGLPIPGEK